MQGIVVDNLTERDKIIRTLAELEVNCSTKLQRHICVESSCSECPMHTRFNYFANQLPDFDRFQVDILAESKLLSTPTHAAYIEPPAPSIRGTSPIKIFLGSILSLGLISALTKLLFSIG